MVLRGLTSRRREGSSLIVPMAGRVAIMRRIEDLVTVHPGLGLRATGRPLDASSLAAGLNTGGIVA